jgi:hypothetical protein
LFQNNAVQQGVGFFTIGRKMSERLSLECIWI